MVATVGGQPQVVTFALDALLSQGIIFSDLIVLYLAQQGKRSQQALARLAAEFAGGRYQGQPLRYHPQPVRSGRQPLADIHDEADAMHLPPDSGFRLIRVPMMPWGSYFPALRDLARPAVAGDVLAGPRAMLDAAERARCQAVVDRLTGRQLDVLRAFALGLRPQEVAERLCLSIKTVDTHKTAILAECRNAWGLPLDGRVDYRFLNEKFEFFFDARTYAASDKLR